MLIGITGLHGAGKSYFASNIPPKYGFEVYNKKQIVEYICEKENNNKNWRKWYSQEFNKDPYKMTQRIIEYLPLEKDIMLDAIHSNVEWEAIKSIVPSSMLVAITTPEYVRAKRREDGDEAKDIQRIKYWHSSLDDTQGCLLSKVSWSFNGADSLEMNEKAFKGFIDFINKKEIDLKEKSNKKIDFSDNKDERILDLIKENEKLSIKLAETEKLLGEYKLIKAKSEKSEEIDER